MVNNNNTNKPDDKESTHLLFVEHKSKNENENKNENGNENENEHENQLEQEMEAGTDYRIRLLLLPASLLLVLLVMVATSFFSSFASVPIVTDQNSMDVDEGAISLFQFRTSQSSVNADCSKEGGPCSIGMHYCCTGFKCIKQVGILVIDPMSCVTTVVAPPTNAPTSGPAGCPLCLVPYCDGCINCPKCILNCSGCNNCPECTGNCEYCNNCPKCTGNCGKIYSYDPEGYPHLSPSCTNCPECTLNCDGCQNDPEFI